MPRKIIIIDTEEVGDSLDSLDTSSSIGDNTGGILGATAGFTAIWSTSYITSPSIPNPNDAMTATGAGTLPTLEGTTTCTTPSLDADAAKLNANTMSSIQNIIAMTYMQSLTTEELSQFDTLLDAKAKDFTNGRNTLNQEIPDTFNER